MVFADNPPNQTVYVNNLNEKLKKTELKRCLYHLFSQYGNILDIYAHKSTRLRGQAWIVFDNLSGATHAVREADGLDFFGKHLRISYAKRKSDVVAKMDGTYKPTRKATDKKTVSLVKLLAKPNVKKPFKIVPKSMLAPPPRSANATRPSAQGPEAPPNKILFLENLPVQCNDMVLAMLFQQYKGYKEARLVAGKPGIAFVEFEDQYRAGVAKDGLQGFKITPTDLMKITYARQ